LQIFLTVPCGRLICDRPASATQSGPVVDATGPFPLFFRFPDESGKKP